MIDYPAADATRDEVIEWVARELEQADLRDFIGIASKRKRDREDAALRSETRVEQRAEIADWLRAMIGREDLAPRAILEHIAGLSPDHDHSADLRDAWPLAWQRLVEIEVSINCADNCLPPRAQYRITLTDRGRAMLAEQPPATNAEDSGSTTPADGATHG